MITQRWQASIQPRGRITCPNLRVDKSSILAAIPGLLSGEATSGGRVSAVLMARHGCTGPPGVEGRFMLVGREEEYYF